MVAQHNDLDREEVILEKKRYLRLKGDDDFTALRDDLRRFLQLFLDGPEDIPAVSARDQGAWLTGLDASRLVNDWLDRLPDTLQPYHQTKEPEGSDELANFRLTLFFELNTVRRALARMDEKIRNEEKFTSLGARFRSRYWKRFANDAVKALEHLKGENQTWFSLRFGFFLLDREIMDRRQRPALQRTIIACTSPPTSQEYGPPAKVASSTETNLTSDQLIQVLEARARLARTIFALAAVFGLDASGSPIHLDETSRADALAEYRGSSTDEQVEEPNTRVEYYFEQPTYFSANPVVPASSTSEAISASKVEFDRLLRELLQSGDTSAAILEGEILLFRNDTIQEAKVTTLSLMLPTSALENASDAFKRYEQKAIALAQYLAQIEFQLALTAALSMAAFESAMFEYKRKPSSPNALNLLRRQVYTCSHHFDSKLDKTEEQLVSLSYRRLDGFPSARDALVENSLVLRRWRKRLRETEQEVREKEREMTEKGQEIRDGLALRLSRGQLDLQEIQTRIAKRVDLLAVVGIVASYVLAVFPLLLSSELNLSPVQWVTLVVATALWLLAVASFLQWIRREESTSQAPLA